LAIYIHWHGLPTKSLYILGSVLNPELQTGIRGWGGRSYDIDAGFVIGSPLKNTIIRNSGTDYYFTAWCISI
jgi:hypothetical protein